MSYLGCHVGLSAPKYYVGTVEEALSYDADTFMFYTGAPQNTRRKDLSELRIEEGRALLRAHGLDESKIVVHAPYIINLGNKDKPETFDLAKSFLIEELRLAAGFGASKLVLHPGSHVGHDERHGMESLLLGLEEVCAQDGTEVTICLETMAGKGSEIGVSFEFFAEFIARFPFSDRIGICLDTCHVHDAGYDVLDADALLKDFDRVLGLDRLKVVHLNDSKNPRGAHKDRHENLGLGHIGFEALHRFVVHPALQEIPIILETPWVEEVPPYKKEIAMLRSGAYEADWREHL